MLQRETDCRRSLFSLQLLFDVYFCMWDFPVRRASCCLNAEQGFPPLLSKLLSPLLSRNSLFSSLFLFGTHLFWITAEQDGYFMWAFVGLTKRINVPYLGCADGLDVFFFLMSCQVQQKPPLLIKLPLVSSNKDICIKMGSFPIFFFNTLDF